MSKWVEYRVGDHLEILSGFPFESDHFSTADGFPLIRIRDLINSNTELKYTGPYDRRWIIKKGDVLIGMDGDFALVRWKSVEALLNQRILKVDSKAGSSVLLDFFFYWFQPRLNKIHQTTAATTVKHLSIRDVTGCCGEFPPLPQQRRIAEILSTVDDAIEATEALIAKQQQIKQGLMHDLLTRGVWTAESIARAQQAGSPAAASAKPGQLRPCRETAPALYKESPLGWIPTDWEVKGIEKLLAPVACPMRSGPFGSALLKHELASEGVPFLGIDNIYQELFKAKFKRFVPDQKFFELNRYKVLPGDVIITIMGTVGRCCVFPEGIGPALSSKHLWTMTFDSDQVIPELVCWQLCSAKWVHDWFRRETQGAVMDAIQSSTLRKLQLPVPPLIEQRKIAERYQLMNEVVSDLEKSMAKLQKQKQGLMQDLLTERVPVI